MSGGQTRLVLTAGPLRSEWLHGYTEDERTAVVDMLLAQSGQQVFQLYMWDKPAGGRDFPLVYMTVAVDGPMGAAHFYDHYAEQTRDAAVVTSGTEPAQGSEPLMFRREAGIMFPSNAVVTREELRTLMVEFVTTGGRPSSVVWQSVDFV
jgi:hypothetical protein